MTISRTTARLTALGYEQLLLSLLDGLFATVELPFSSLKAAKAVQALLYKWLTFYPDVKARTTLRLDLNTATLFVLPRGTKEKRGRRRIL